MPGEYVTKKINGRCYQEHRLVMERHLGRRLLPTEDVHHKNGIKNDNRVENLEVIDAHKHRRVHQLGKKYDSVVRKKDSENAKRQWKTMYGRMIHASHARAVAAYTKDGELYAVFDSMKSAEKEGFVNQAISAVVDKPNRTYRGFRWISV